MTMMNNCRVALALLVFTTFGAYHAAIAQVPLGKGIKVNGVSLGSTSDAVIAKLGKPSSEKDNKCDHGKARGLIYDGLTVNLDLLNEKDSEARVAGFVITSGSWQVSGVKVGDTESRVRAVFGRPDEQDGTPDKKSKAFFYLLKGQDFEGSTRFGFEDGKLTSIRSGYLVFCVGKK